MLILASVDQSENYFRGKSKAYFNELNVGAIRFEYCSSSSRAEGKTGAQITIGKSKYLATVPDTSAEAEQAGPMTTFAPASMKLISAPASADSTHSPIAHDKFSLSYAGSIPSATILSQATPIPPAVSLHPTYCDISVLL
ncbi:unnamed protein product [Haemonchus placei]|uniref:Uncharacterized protein n=1 Tax=Haemonchus placei TaxID=6290 RepID=A0A0N4VW79_HAEPC|nr:unnamed protein product [Haemonchus placei]